MEKRKKLRHNEYYDIQEIFDEIWYSQSQQGKYFRNLISIMKKQEKYPISIQKHQKKREEKIQQVLMG
ncbi:Protein LepA (plasmid) [Bacillus thuringiensis serovar finitimus YBT-020]|nr:Protein LepA [Bacillus thuringiensis serovar finitimus YBT-020]